MYPSFLDKIRHIISRGSGDGCLPEFGGGHPFCFPPDPPVVAVADVLGHGPLQVPERPEFRLVPVEHLVLHGPEEGLHYGVVEAVPLPGHGLGYAHLPEPPPVVGVPVLPALVAVEDEAFQPAAPTERPVEHPLGLWRVGGPGEAPRGYLPGEHVPYGGWVGLPERAGELRHVGRPLLVGPCASSRT